MKRAFFTLVASATAAPLCLAQPVPTTLTQAGYTGLGLTPNANLVGWGRMEFAYDDQLAGVVRKPSGHNYVLGFGLLPNLEIAGRLAANDNSSNCFVASGCGVRDLSASAKLGIGLDAAGHFHIAAGATDIGGAATFFRSYYGVLTYNQGKWEASGGYGRRSGQGVNGSRSPLDGPFASAAWQPYPWVRAQAEYTDGHAWAGLRLFAPRTWLPEGWSAYIGANQRLTNTELTEKHWFSAGISIPLYKVPDMPGGGGTRAPLPTLVGSQQPLPAYEARTPAPAASPAPIAPNAPAQPAASVDDAMLHVLAAALKARSLEDLWVGRMPDGSIAVRANNATYNWNSLDALGAALGAVAEALGDTRAVYRLILTQRQVPLVAVTGQADCLRRWIDTDGAGCAAGELSTPGSTALDRLQAGATWVVRNEVPSWRTLRVGISPVLRSTVGTEVGVFDYSLGANVGLQLPLWKGASIETRYDIPIANSDDFDDGGVFSERRIRSRVERVAFTQTLRLPVEAWSGANDAAVARWGLANVTGQASIGRFGGYYDGAYGALRWEPGGGKHRVLAEAGWFEHTDFGASGMPGARTPRPALLHYRYNFAPTRTYWEATAGRFMNNDAGFQVGLRQWFSDVAVDVYYRRTRFQDSPEHQFVGIQLSLPIGPRRDMDPHWFQVTGTPRFSHAIESVVRENGRNPTRTGYGATPPVPSLEVTTFNSDRAGLVYFEDNIRRIRDAARQTSQRGDIHGQGLPPSGR